MTDRLDIINAALGASGVSPVTTYDSTHPDVLIVDPVINKVSKQVQKKGWWFNTDYKLGLLPDVNGKVLIPATTLKIDPSDTTLPYTKRGNYLYDPVLHTFALSKTVEVNIVWLLDIADLPESAALYILERVVHEFYVNDDGDMQKAKVMEDRKKMAWIELKNDELANRDINSRNRPQSLELRAGISNFGLKSNTFDPTYPGGSV